MKMSLKIGLVLSVPMMASLALAQQAGLPAVEVTAEEGEVSDVVLTISCSDPVPPELSDVSRLLKITDASKAPDMRNKLMVAAAEACVAGESKIAVQRTSAGVIWAPAKTVASDGN